jgi:hypothetical protein
MDDQTSPQAQTADPEEDEHVYSFMRSMVQEKHGDDVDYDFLEDEAKRLYELFGDVLLKYFEPQLNEEQKVQFDQLIDGGESQDALMSFLMENIGNLEQQIIDVLVKFRTDYITDQFTDNKSGTTSSDDSADNSINQ